MEDLRLLDFDDLFILQNLQKGLTLTAVSKVLQISQPAVSQRLRKMEGIYGYLIVEQQGRRVQLSEAGTALAQQASAALHVMSGFRKITKQQVIQIGTRPEIGVSWLGEAILQLRKSHPHYCFHLVFGSGSEILQKLGSGQLDAVLTSAPVTIQDFQSWDLAQETYSFVGSPGILDGVQRLEHLQNLVLIEYDRSFPFLRYLQPEFRAQLSFRDVWFLGSTVMMAKALERGMGVGIVPTYLVQKALSEAKLKHLPFKVPVGEDSFRLIYRQAAGLEEPVACLAKLLKKIGLR